MRRPERRYQQVAAFRHRAGRTDGDRHDHHRARELRADPHRFVPLAGRALACGLHLDGAAFVANRFWELPMPQRFRSENTFFEHLGLRWFSARCLA
jgi:hypothetical protein